jgi:hypothetical protein
MLPSAANRWTAGWALLNPLSAEFLVRVTFLAWIPAQAIGLIVAILAPGPLPPQPPFETYTELIFVALIFGPIVETQAMRGAFYLCRRHAVADRCACEIIAILAWALHNPSPSWGTHALWSFWVMARAYRSIERRESRAKAIWLTTLIHALFNTLSFGFSELVDCFG